MKYIVYISTTSKILTESELTEMLRENYLNNRRANITGMLIYTEGSFIQVLEGPEESLKKATRILCRITVKKILSNWPRIL